MSAGFKDLSFVKDLSFDSLTVATKNKSFQISNQSTSQSQNMQADKKKSSTKSTNTYKENICVTINSYKNYPSNRHRQDLIRMR